LKHFNYLHILLILFSLIIQKFITLIKMDSRLQEIEQFERYSELAYHNLMNESRFEESNLVLAIWRMSILMKNKSDFVSTDEERFNYYFDTLKKLYMNIEKMYENEKFEQVYRYKDGEIEEQVKQTIEENNKLLSEDTYIVQALQEVLEAILDDEEGDDEEEDEEGEDGMEI